MNRGRNVRGLAFGRKLDPRNNSLNLIRLVLAAMVLVAHSFHLAGAGAGPVISGENLGGWAVAGFFTISGFLISASRFTHPLGEYLVHRVARIYPAFLVCLLVTVAFFAPIAFVFQNGTVDGYFGTETTPVRFVFANLFLKMNVYDVSFTPATVPFAGSWNGSLWTLYYEFVCYLLVAFLGVFALFRRSVWPALILFLGSVAVWANLDRVTPYLQDVDFTLLARLVPFFLGGVLVQLLSRRIGLHWLPGVASGAVSLTLILAVPHWGGQAAAPFITYFLLWFSTVLPSPRLVRVHDVSYGFYIYAWPVQQLLALFGVHAAGLLVYNLTAAAGTFVLAAGSWLFVERPVMRMVRKRKKTVAVSAQQLVPVSPVSMDAGPAAASSSGTHDAGDAGGARQPAAAK